MKKLNILSFLTAAALLLCSCGEVKNPQLRAVSMKNSEAADVTAPTSSLITRHVDYDEIEPSGNIDIPADYDDITSLGKIIYVLKDHQVSAVGIESGEVENVFEAGGEMISKNKDTLFTYSPKTGDICGFTADGEKVAEENIKIENGTTEVENFLVTDSFYDILCVDKSGDIYVKKHLIFSRKSGEAVREIEEKQSGWTFPDTAFSEYRDDMILKACESRSNPEYADIFSLDLATGEETEIASVEVGAPAPRLAVCFREKTDSVLISAAPGEGDNVGFTPFLAECTAEGDCMILKKFYEVGQPEYPEIFTCENIAVAVFPGQKTAIYDWLSREKSVTLACSVRRSYEDLIENFERESGINVNIFSCGRDFSRLDDMIMAGGEGFDIYVPNSCETRAFLCGIFEDLSGYAGIKSRIDDDEAARKISDLDGKTVGVPGYIMNFTDPDDPSRKTFESTPLDYSRVVSKYLYITQNLDISTGSFYDPDGKKLYKLLNYLYKNPNGSSRGLPFGDELELMYAGFFVMNKNSAKKEDSAKFLEAVYDGCKGNYDCDDPENAYVFWKVYEPYYTGDILNAATEVMRSDGKKSSIKNLAAKTAKKVAEKMNELRK